MTKKNLKGKKHPTMYIDEADYSDQGDFYQPTEEDRYIDKIESGVWDD